MRDTDLPKYIYFDNGKVETISHGWSFRDLCKKEEERLGIKILKYGMQHDYPDYQFVVVSNDANYVNNSLHNTLGTLLEGLMTTGLVLFLFLRGWRSTLAVMLAIPTSLISSFFAMYAAGFTF